MQINFYVINLDRSADRLAAIQADAASAGIRLIRVAAIDGKSVPEGDRTHLDERGFQRLHGKRPLPGEYGCYVSHLAALDGFIASGADAAVIFEDDVRPKPAFLEVLQEIVAKDDWDLVKLAHHRRPAIRALRQVGEHRLGRALFGPTGSSAAYLVRREAAAQLRQGLDPMRLPFDIALERGWALELRVLHAVPDLVRFNSALATSLTMDGESYRSRKLPPWRRLTTLGFRSAELVRLLAYAAAGRSA